MNRKQSYVPGEGFEVLFDGSKTFWKCRTNLDVLIVLHNHTMCIEVAAFNPKIGNEAPRIYVSWNLIVQEISGEDFQARLSAKKEILIRQKKTNTPTELAKEVRTEIVLSMILLRLNIITEGTDATKEVIVNLLPSFGDALNPDNEKQLNFVIEKPPHLKPVIVNFTKKAR